MPSPALVRLTDSTRRLVRTVDALDEDAFAAPSLLPGWSRAHVVAHLALNAEAMARGLDGVRTGRPTTLYGSPERRAADIEALARASRTVLRERFLGSATTLAELVEVVRDPALGRREVEWYPGGMRRPVAAFADVRRGEVEVHHADLGVEGYDHTDWPGDFCAWVIGVRSSTVEAPAFTVYAGDLDRSWPVAGGADGDPVVTGRSHDLAWWLAGRGDGEGLACDTPLPRIGGW